MSSKLSDSQLGSELAALPDWKLDDGEIVRNLTFGDFMQAISFVDQVAELAETAHHHPDIDIRYNRVRLALVTHDSAGITRRDLDLAARISAIVQK